MPLQKFVLFSFYTSCDALQKKREPSGDDESGIWMKN